MHGYSYTHTSVDVPEGEERRIIKFENPLSVHLPTYPEGILDIFPKNSQVHPWALEGIDFDTLTKYEVAYSSSYEGVVIPHRDWRGDLIGVRLRTYNPEKAKKFKYMPMLINNTYYRHPISLNFLVCFKTREQLEEQEELF